MRTTILIVAILLSLSCASTTKEEQPSPTQTAEVTAFEQELRDIFENRSSDAPVPIAERVERVLVALRKEIEQDYQRKLRDMFGAPEPLKDETFDLEAIAEDGSVQEVPFTTKTRTLRSLTDPRVKPKAQRLLSEDDLALELYAHVPEPIRSKDQALNMRVYTGEDAAAIAMEARLIVSLKGGEWAEAETGQPVANTIAVRGLDLTRGLIENSNKTYDDTVYVVIELRDATPEVYEFRMTTESSNPRKGVGRLDSRQVYYRRGLHKGKDPAFRLVGNAAPGTRSGMQGQFEITGANIHSAYTRRPIDSATPLSPNVSLGCQVIAASKAEFERRFIALFDRNEIREFPYTIVEDTELAELDRILREESASSVLVEAVPRS